MNARDPSAGPGRPAVLVFNAGSSSIKFAAYGLEADRTPGEALLTGQIDGIGVRPHVTARDAAGSKEDVDLALDGPLEVQHARALSWLIGWLSSHGDGLALQAVGHRVVHGGPRFTAPALLDDATVAVLEGFVPLAPLHQPHNLAAVKVLARDQPRLPQVACFDTAFHARAPAVSRRFGLPRALHDEGVRRYGFHGLSYESIATGLPAVAGARSRGRVLVAHLGNGASLCAMREGRSVDTSMGFTAVDGLMMGTRTGALDPGVVLYLLEHKGWDAARITRLLYKESGLLGVSGLSPDMRTLLASDAPEAREAVDLFCYRVVREAGALVAAMGGLDVLVFTGGIGEHAPAIRARIAGGLAWLGLDLDPAETAAAEGRGAAPRVDASRPAAVISQPGSRVLALAMHTDEERMIAWHTARLALGNAAAPAAEVSA